MADFLRPDLTEESAYKALINLFNDHGKTINLRNLFLNDINRYEKFRYLALSCSNALCLLKIYGFIKINYLWLFGNI